MLTDPLFLGRNLNTRGKYATVSFNTDQPCPTRGPVEGFVRPN